jgi:hypothetical protein
LIPAECEAITPEMLPLIELTAQQIETIVASVPGGAKNVQDIYPLAPLQEGILFHHLLNERDTYALPILLALATRERVTDFIEALQAVVDRHDMLRTAVLWMNTRWRRSAMSASSCESGCCRSASAWICSRHRCCGCRWRARTMGCAGTCCCGCITS